MTKQIASVKIPLNASGGMTLRRAVRLFEMIRKCHCKAYFLDEGATFPLNSLPKAVSYLLTKQTKDILLVLEGEDIRKLHKEITEMIRLARENARENPGLYRHG